MSKIPLKISIKNCKCFGEEAQNINEIYPINLIIGKNNSGKSALIDVAQYVTNPALINLVGHKKSVPEIFLTKIISENQIRSSFREDTFGGGVPGQNFYEFGKSLEGRPMTIKLEKNGDKKFVGILPPINLPENVIANHGFEENLTRSFTCELHGKTFKKIDAERNIVPELNQEINLLASGVGATNVIQKFINLASMGNRELVEIDLLKALNEIFYPEARFDRILLQQLNDDKWEVYLEELNKGIISLSDSGSGLKTVLLVLINLLLLHKLEGKSLSNYIFGFEELENNLHPSIQRKLLLYIKSIAVKESCIFFITTHSNVLIDLFSQDENAQIIHIINNGSSAVAKKAQTYIDNKNILDDLDFRASDLLQANGIVWLEGPSDRVYFNQWISLFTDGEIKEGVHYQCLIYGGRLLSNFTISPSELSEMISILKINRNCILLMDSDKKTESTDINNTKKRIEKEVTSIDGIAWVTNGREIENYIPGECLKQYYKIDAIKKIEKFDNFSEYLETIKEGEGKKFEDNKILFSKNISQFFTKDLLKDQLDLEKMMSSVVNKIKEWNKLK